MDSLNKIAFDLVRDVTDTQEDDFDKMVEDVKQRAETQIDALKERIAKIQERLSRDLESMERVRGMVYGLRAAAPAPSGDTEGGK